MSIDPVTTDANTGNSFNRYTYANNSPYRYIDPDGRQARGIEINCVAGCSTYGSLTIRSDNSDSANRTSAQYSFEMMGKVLETGLKYYVMVMTAIGPDALALEGGAVVAAGLGAKSGKAATELVQRWMSKAELRATQETGLLRGGRDGTHYVTDAANSNPIRARLRSALPKTPEVRTTLEVRSGTFSSPSKVEPRFNMPGGGMERTATGDVPVTILGVQ